VRMLDYLRILRDRWVLVTACALLGAVAAVAVVLGSTWRYASSITLYVSSTDHTPTANTAYEASLLAQQQVQSYARLLDSERVANELATRIGGAMTPQQLQAEITASAIPQTALLRATVTDTSAGRAQRVAEALGPAFADVVDSLESHADGAPSPVRISVVDDAAVPDGPISPRPRLDVLLGVAVGLLVGAGAAVLRETADTTVKTVGLLRAAVCGPVLASVGTLDESHLEAVREHRSPRAEAYRSLRTNLQFLNVDRPVTTVTVTSSIAGEGKSLTACNLALSLADSGRKVVLIDADLRRPQICGYLGLRGYNGLTSVLAGSTPLEQAMIVSRREGLLVLPSGPIPPNPSELLGSARMAQLLEQLKQDADILVLDSPPLLPVTDAAILAHISDGAILVAQYGRTRREHVTRAVEQIKAADARLLGAILNRMPSRGGEADSYSYYGYAAVPPGFQIAEAEAK